jgi:hypothetical protein
MLLIYPFEMIEVLIYEQAPNELRIDAAEGDYAKRKGRCAAASVRVELSRIWKKKPGASGKNIL